MQSLGVVTTAQLKEACQNPCCKVEIYVSAAWVDLSALDSKNYVKSLSISFGSAVMTSDPVAGSWSAVIDNTDNVFHPDHPTSLYTGYFVTGRKVRISIGGTYGTPGVAYYWQRMIGYMGGPRFSVDGREIYISGFDYMKTLADAKVKSTSNFWGTTSTVSTKVTSRRYDMPADCKGVYYAVWNGTPIYGGSHFAYDETNNQFVLNTLLEDGTPQYLCSGIVLAGTMGWGKILRSTDYGFNWTDLGMVESLPAPPFAYLLPNFCDCTGGVVLAAAPSQSGHLYRSTNYGANWTDLGHITAGAYVYCFTYCGSGVVIAGGWVAGVAHLFKSTDYGATWSDIKTIAGDFGVLSLAYLGSGIVVAGMDQSGKIYRSADSGSTWADMGQLGAETAIPSLVSLEDGIALAGTSPNGKIYRSTNYGATWTDVAHGYSSLTISTLSNLGEGVVIAGGATAATGNIYRSTDYGIHWIDLGQLSDALSVDSSAYAGNGIALAGMDRAVFGGNSNYIFRSLDLGVTWNMQGPALGELGIISLCCLGTGVDNLVCYYFQAQAPENVIADLLVSADLYADRAAALADMTYTATGITINRVWFDAGSSILNSISKICERCNYVFRMSWDGKPQFIPAPTVAAWGAEAIDFHQKEIAGISTYEDENEIWNEIIIEGEQAAQPTGRDQTMTSRIKGYSVSNVSIASYGRRTKTITNHLFQDEITADAKAVVYRDEYKDPKKYSDFTLEFLPAPIELGDTVRWQVRLTTPADCNYYGIPLYGAVKYSSNGIVIVKHGIVRDIKINNYGAQIRCQEEA